MTPTYQLESTPDISRFLPAMMFVLMAISSVVDIEPAPFDLLTLLLLLILVPMGLRIPAGMGLVLFYSGLFILGNILSFSDVENFGAALKYMAISIYMFVIFVLIACLVYYDPKRILPAFWKGYVFAAVLASLVGVLAYFGLLPDAENFLRYGRAKAMFKDPNVYAPFLIAPMFYLAYRMLTSGGRKQLLFAAGFSIMALGMLVGFSRGAIGNMIVAAIIVLAIKFAKQPSLKLFVSYVVYGSGLLLLLLAMMVAALQTDKVKNMIAERAKLVQSYDVEGAGSRFVVQKKTLIHGLSDPLGFGPGEESLEFYIEPHNVYLYILSENGWLGFLGFVAFIFSGIRLGAVWIRRNQTISDEYLIIYAVVVSTALQSLLIDSIHWRHLFILNGVLWGWTLAMKKQQTSNEIESFDLASRKTASNSAPQNTDVPQAG